MKIAYLTICRLFPDYSDQPHAALDHIKKVYLDRDGNQVNTLVYAYYMRLISAAWPFTRKQFYPISLRAKFMEGMDPRLVADFRRNLPTHSTVQMLRADHQRKILQDMLIAAQRSKTDLASVQQAAREAVGLSQSFVARAEARGATAFPS